MACFGGHQSKLISKMGTEIAVLDKFKKIITLVKGTKLTYIGNCKVDNPEVDLSKISLNIYDYTDQGGQLCLGIKKGNEEIRFTITDDEINKVTKGQSTSRTSKKCGGTISADK